MEKEISELRLFRMAASKELERMKNELERSRISEDSQSASKDLSSEEHRLRNIYEVAISNLNSQMNGLRTKMENLQLHYDIKCR